MSKDPNTRVLGPTYYNMNGIWALESYYLGPGTLGKIYMGGIRVNKNSSDLKKGFPCRYLLGPRISGIGRSKRCFLLLGKRATQKQDPWVRDLSISQSRGSPIYPIHRPEYEDADLKFLESPLYKMIKPQSPKPRTQNQNWKRLPRLGMGLVQYSQGCLPQCKNLFACSKRAI